jgi:hypothetical protein
VLLACAAHAHVVSGVRTLQGQVGEADLVVRARIVAVERGPTPLSDELRAGRPAVEAEVLETFKGEKPGPRIRFVQHGHGAAPFEPGDAALLFLADIARSRELDVLGEIGTHEWVSVQEDADGYPLTSDNREHLLTATRAYVAANASRSPDARIPHLRRATLALLTSGDARLAASALRELALAPALPLVTPADLPALHPVLQDPQVSMGVRTTLLTELGRRGLVEERPLWLELLAPDTPPVDLVRAIAAAGASSDAQVRGRLVALVAAPDPRVAAAAAGAIGTPGNREALPVLVAALSSDSARLRMAAVRSLGRIGLPESREALDTAGASHPDAETRRRARAEAGKQRAPGP